MGKLREADEAAHNELRQLSRLINPSILIEPLIWESDQKSYRHSELGVKIICGTDRPFEHLWLTHMGDRTGPEWEQSKLIWKHLYQYVKDHIGAMMVLAAKQLGDEASYISQLDEEKLSKMFATSADLARFYIAMGSIYKAGVPYESVFQMWIADYAHEVKERLTGQTKINVGSDARLRFSPAEMKRLIEVLKDEQTLWQRARNVFWANQNNPDWRQLVKAECLKLNEHHPVDDDLLEAISERTDKGDFKYRPVQVAHVSAARQASFDNKEEWYSPPTMQQYKRIGEAVKEWRKRLDEAKQLNLRW